MNFKSHKIPGIDKEVCNKEQKIAYNYLFSWTLNDHEKNYALSCIKKELKSKQAGTYNELYKPIHPYKPGGVNYLLVFYYIVSAYERYKKLNSPIFSNYRDLASVIY